MGQLVYMIVVKGRDGSPGGAEKAWDNRFWLTRGEADAALLFDALPDVRGSFTVAPFTVSPWRGDSCGP